MDENTLLQHIVKGDRNAFDTLVGGYYAPLTVFASRLIGYSRAAEDIVQDAFVHIWEHRSRLNNTTHLRNYLYLIVHNYAVDYLRISARRHSLTRDVVMPDDDVLAEYIRVETSRMLYAAVESLPPRTAEIMKLTLEGMKQESIAEQMGITLATVKAQKAEGIKKLQKVLGTLSCLLF